MYSRTHMEFRMCKPAFRFLQVGIFKKDERNIVASHKILPFGLLFCTAACCLLLLLLLLLHMYVRMFQCCMYCTLHTPYIDMYVSQLNISQHKLETIICRNMSCINS